MAEKARKKLKSELRREAIIQNALKIIVVPTRLETFGMDANTRRFFLTQQVETDMA